MAATDTSKPEPAKPDGASDPMKPLPSKAWWHRHLEPEERRRIMNDLAITKIEHWAYRFVVMITLSVVVAVMGLSLNSAAVVIGAMLLAPLMQPVLAVGASLSMALFTKSLIALGKVAAATVWCIAIAFVLSWLLPEQDLTNEVLARTKPDIKDLVVGLAAGAAGAYATVRSDASSSLPGVAVAVALVPPLASVGITLERGERLLAEGALLLYVTNLAAIIVASIVVFIITGFVPPRRLSDNLLRLILAGGALTAVTVLVAVPLYATTIDTIDQNNDQELADTNVTNWLGDLNDDLASEVNINRKKQQIVVELRGPKRPPEQSDLEEQMLDDFPDYAVAVQWIQTFSATTTTEPPPEPTERLLAEIRVVVDDWLTTAGFEYQIDSIVLEGNQVRIAAAGNGDPPPIDDLIPRLQEVEPGLTPWFTWARLQTATDDTAPDPIELQRQEMDGVIADWAAQRSLVVRSFEFDGQQVEIDVQGEQQPDIARLELALQQITGDDVPISVYFTQRLQVTTTTAPEVPVETR